MCRWKYRISIFKVVRDRCSLKKQVSLQGEVTQKQCNRAAVTFFFLNKIPGEKDSFQRYRALVRHSLIYLHE